MEMRHEGSVEYPKQVSNELHPVLGVKEVNTLEEFEEMAGTGDSAALKKQALLMSERILGAAHKDTIFRYNPPVLSHLVSNWYFRAFRSILKLVFQIHVRRSCSCRCQ